MKQFNKAFTLFLLSLSQGTTPALAGTSSDGGIGSNNVIVCHEVIAASLSSTPPVTRAAASDNLGDANRNDKLRKRSIYSDNEKEDSSEQEEIRYFCVIKESKEGTRLELLNVPPSFKDDMERNVQIGKKHLVITNGLLRKSTLELPVSTTNFGTFGEIAVDPSHVRKLSAEEETRMGGVALGSWEWKYPSPKNRSFKPRKTMEMDADTCSDDPSFEFTIDIGNKVGCQWLRQREDKIATRVDRYCSRTHVRFACPKSCLEDEGLPCACPSDVDEFTFDLDVAGTEQECSWLTRNSENTLDRQQRYCYDDENTEAASDDVGESCITSCGFCRGSFIAPSSSPSSSPTECVDEPDWKTHQLGFTCAEIQELVLEGPEFDYCVKFSNAVSQGKSIYEACCVCGGSAFQPISPSMMPSVSLKPTMSPSRKPSSSPSNDPSNVPSRSPSFSPTKSPSSSPSNTPTVSPSLLPSNHPTVNCSDDPNFTFVLDNGEVQFCEWLTRNEEKSDTRIDNYCSRGHVKGACQKSCSFCECADDDEHTFPLQNLDASRGCSWLTQSSDPFVNEDRLDRYCYADLAKTVASEDVGDFCVFSCGFCKGNYRTPPEFLS